MNVNLPAEPMIIAVSGGVDSVVLLDLIIKNSVDKDLITVAHFDHGIRHSSHHDSIFVAGLAAQYGVRFVSERKELGQQASEELARVSRYEFLTRVKNQYKAQRIITAHHADDRVETAIINMMRGTGSRGLSALSSSDELTRPLLVNTKKQIIEYAKTHQLKWREDHSNDNQAYLRNYVRLRLIPAATKTDPDFSRKMIEIIDHASELNKMIDAELDQMLPDASEVYRYDFIMLPHSVACELMRTILEENDCKDINRATIERLVVASKTARPNTSHDICHHLTMQASKEKILFIERKVSTRV